MNVNLSGKRKRENELLSDLLYHDGWKVVKQMFETAEKNLIDISLIPAQTEWEAVRKDGYLTAINQLRGLMETIEDRARQYRKSVTPRKGA